MADSPIVIDESKAVGVDYDFLENTIPFDQLENKVYHEFDVSDSVFKIDNEKAILLRLVSDGTGAVFSWEDKDIVKCSELSGYSNMGALAEEWGCNGYLLVTLTFDEVIVLHVSKAPVEIDASKAVGVDYDFLENTIPFDQLENKVYHEFDVSDSVFKIDNEKAILLRLVSDGTGAVFSWEDKDIVKCSELSGYSNMGALAEEWGCNGYLLVTLTFDEVIVLHVSGIESNDPVVRNVSASPAEFGEIIVDKECTVGSTLTIKVVPDEGYYAKHVRYSVDNGENFKECVAEFDGIFSLKMPDSDIVISAEFARIESGVIDFGNEEYIRSLASAESPKFNEFKVENGHIVTFDNDIIFLQKFPNNCVGGDHRQFWIAPVSLNNGIYAIQQGHNISNGMFSFAAPRIGTNPDTGYPIYDYSADVFVDFNTTFSSAGKTYTLMDRYVEYGTKTNGVVALIVSEEGFESHNYNGAFHIILFRLDSIAYDVVFDTDGGSLVDSTAVEYNADVNAPATIPTKEGYNFVKWDTEFPLKMPAKDITVKAIWEINSYTFTFENGDEIKFTVENMADKSMPEVPAKEHYTGAWDVSEFSLEDKTVKAVYTPVEYTFVFMNGDSKVDEIEFTILDKADQKLPEVPAKEHYTGAWDVTEFSLEDKTVNAIYTYVVPATAEKDVKVELTVDTFKMPAEQKETVTVTMNDAVFVKVADASSLADKNVTAKVEKAAVNNTGIEGTVYEFIFEVEGTGYTGNMQVTVPYTPIDGKEPVVYFYNNGAKEAMKIISSDSSSVTFETSHNSTYVVTSEVPEKSEDNTLLVIAVIVVIVAVFTVGMLFCIRRAGKA